MMKQKHGTKKTGDFKESPYFFEELLKMRTQHLIQTLMEKHGVIQEELAKRLHLTEGAVSRLLDSDRNLTLGSVSKIFFALGYEVKPFATPVETYAISDMWTHMINRSSESLYGMNAVSQTKQGLASEEVMQEWKDAKINEVSETRHEFQSIVCGASTGDVKAA